MATLHRNILKYVLPRKNDFWLQLLKPVKIFQILKKKYVEESKNQMSKLPKVQKNNKEKDDLEKRNY